MDEHIQPLDEWIKDECESDDEYVGGYYSDSDDEDEMYSRCQSKETATPLPEGWEEHHSEADGRSFYHNKATSESVWDRPVAEPAVFYGDSDDDDVVYESDDDDVVYDSDDSDVQSGYDDDGAEPCASAQKALQVYKDRQAATTRAREYTAREARRERECAEQRAESEQSKREAAKRLEVQEHEEQEEREHAERVERRKAAKAARTKEPLKRGQHRAPKHDAQQEDRQEYAPREEPPTDPGEPAGEPPTEPPMEPGEPPGEPPDPGEPPMEPGEPPGEPPDPGQPPRKHSRDPEPTLHKLNAIRASLKYDGHTVPHSEQRFFQKNSYSIVALGGHEPRTDVNYDPSIGPQKPMKPPKKPPKMYYNSSANFKEIRAPIRGTPRPTGGTSQPQFNELLESLELHKGHFWLNRSMGTHRECALDRVRSRGGGRRVA
jgi:hypothetical protein